MSGGYLQFQAPQLRCLPVLKFDSADRRMKRIGYLANEYSQNESVKLLLTIDKLVYEIYGLEDGDIMRIEGNVGFLNNDQTAEGSWRRRLRSSSAPEQ